MTHRRCIGLVFFLKPKTAYAVRLSLVGSEMGIRGRDSARLEVNVQRGAESVANPDPTILPEIVRVSRSRADGSLRFERVRRSTLSPSEDLLSEPALRALFTDTLGVTERWLARENSVRPTAQHGRGPTLDFEFHDMLAGRPARRDGRVQPGRRGVKLALLPAGR